MSRQPHDDLAKQFLADLLEPLGRATSSFDVFDETRQVDVFFVPASPSTDAPSLLGLFGRIGTVPCALEIFRNAPEDSDIEDSLNKLYGLRADQRRRSDRGEDTPAELPQLWVLSPTLSDAFRDRFSATARPNWLPGIYAGPEGYRINLIAIHQLPVTPETLMLRELGRGRVQRAAIEEVRALPGSPTVARVLELLENWRYTIEVRQNRNQDDEEVLMNLSPAYLRWREETRQEARQENARASAENLMQLRYGTLDDELARAATAIAQFPETEQARALLAIATQTRDEFLARFGR
ncbi:hypothetical protein KR51_00029650 [Rubidibacter lacunae KORDI 51-2]|uniref:DUF4351 domain-containing protein n=1 Tax=Rubidibacter lacunae KORDI 51-2 TaxID=582515 RepID=U5DL24_9CHRO|nr:hypothetical protein [Rubidibacter lacunae]ERN40425.1 hypothetical protein KR51_00029650 [Rubidibacter lacunae KORDI 51-2]